MAKAKDLNGNVITDADGPVDRELFENSPTDRFLDGIEKIKKKKWREEYERLGIPVPKEYQE